MKRIIIAMLAVMFFAGAAYGADCAVTATLSNRDVFGGTIVAHGYITISAGTYPVEGMALTPADFGMGHIDGISFQRRTGAYDVLYNSGSTLLFLMQAPANTTVVTEDPVTTDSDRFVVVDNDYPGSDDRRLLTVVPSLAGGPNAALAVLDATHVSTRATMVCSRLYAADGTTVVQVGDTANITQFKLRGGPTFADTLFFDDDGADKESRLYYTGNCLGDMGTLYIPYGGGRLLKVLKSTNATLIDLGAAPLYYDYDTTATKLHSDTDGDANSDFGADIVYGSLAPFYGPSIILPDNTTIASDITYWFTAFGK